MITIEHVSKKFGRFTALDDVSLNVSRGESVALWGKNGAGKSTLIRCVIGLFRCSGHIEVNGIDTRRHGKSARAQIGYVPQELGFYDDLRVGQAVCMFARLKGVRRVDTQETLARVALTGHDRKRVRELSGGMKQRLALAIALLGDPPVLVLDEVTASLDSVGRDEFTRILSGLRSSGKTLLFASHRPEEIAALGARVVGMSKGRIDASTTITPVLTPHSDSLVDSIKLRVPKKDTQAALLALSAAGFHAVMNCVGIVVQVDPSRKGVPLNILSNANIAVEDFDVLPPRSTSFPAGGRS